MKTTTIQYSIPDPCSKSWKEMNPETGGRFCGTCETTVIDFTGMPDFSIVNYLESHKHEKVCGRFTQPQLDRVYQLNQPVFAPIFDLKAVVLGLALTTFCAVQSFAQTEPGNPEQPDTTVMIHPTKMGSVSSPNFDNTNEAFARGTIQTESGLYAEVSVQLKNHKGRLLDVVQPDAKGNFELKLDWKKNPAAIEVSGPGFVTVTCYFSSLPSLSNIRIELENEPILIGAVFQGVKGMDNPEEDQILQKIQMGNVGVRKDER